MLSRDLAREDPAVVAMAVHAAGVAREPMLAKPRRRLMDRPAEVDARDRRALPERGLRRQLVAADGRDAELRQILDRTREAGGRDHVVDFEDELGRALGLAGVHAEDRSDSLD